MRKILFSFMLACISMSYMLYRLWKFHYIKLEEVYNHTEMDGISWNICIYLTFLMNFFLFVFVLNIEFRSRFFVFSSSGVQPTTYY